MAHTQVDSLLVTGFPYEAVFDAVEKTVQSVSTRTPDELAKELQVFRKPPTKSITDSDEVLFQKLVMVIFYAGMAAATVTKKRNVILSELGAFESVAKFTAQDVQRIIDVPGMLAHEDKIKACIENAKKFLEIGKNHDTVANYLNEFGPYESRESFDKLLMRLEDTFTRFRQTSAYHYLMEMWLNNVKPDRVLQRVFHRVGLTGDPSVSRSVADEKEFLWSFTEHAREFAKATGNSIRYIDITFMALGQVAIKEFGVKGICLEEKPLCNQCQVRPLCEFAKERA